MMVNMRKIILTFFVLFCIYVACAQQPKATLTFIDYDYWKFDIAYNIEEDGDYHFILPVNEYANPESMIHETLVLSSGKRRCDLQSMAYPGRYDSLEVFINGKKFEKLKSIDNSVQLSLKKGEKLKWNGRIYLPRNHFLYGNHRNFICMYDIFPKYKSQSIDLTMKFPEKLSLLNKNFDVNKADHVYSCKSIVTDTTKLFFIKEDETKEHILTSNNGLVTKTYSHKYNKLALNFKKILNLYGSFFTADSAVIIDGRYNYFNNEINIINNNNLINSSFKTIYPTFRYMHNNTKMYGIKYNYAAYNYEVNFNPYIDSHKELVGEFRYLYKHRLKHGKTLEPSFSFRRFMHTYDNKENFVLYYNKIAPNLRYKFNDHLNRINYLDLRYNYISEEFTLGENFDILSFPSHLVQLRYTDLHANIFESNKKVLNLEYMDYENLLAQNKNFLKLTGILDQKWFLDQCRELNIRLFASYFIVHSDSKANSFSSQITKGTIALIHQGFNDYAYEEYFIARNDRGGILTNQTSYHNGGGFKNAPSGESNLGMSNKAAFSINTSLELLRLKRDLSFVVFGDMGGYARYSKEKLNMKYLYSGGIGLKWKNVFAIYLPVINHKSITENYNNYKLSFFERVSFRFTYNNTFTDRL